MATVEISQCPPLPDSREYHHLRLAVFPVLLDSDTELLLECHRALGMVNSLVILLLAVPTNVICSISNGVPLDLLVDRILVYS